MFRLSKFYLSKQFSLLVALISGLCTYVCYREPHKIQNKRHVQNHFTLTSNPFNNVNTVLLTYLAALTN